MAFPTIIFKYNNLAEAEPLATVVEQKFDALAKYLHGNESVTCEVEFEKVAAQQNGKVFRTEATLVIDGDLFRAEATENSFEEAVDEMRDQLDKELRRKKDKNSTLERQQGRAAKEQITMN